MSIIKEEYWKIVEFISSPKTAFLIYIVTFLLSSLNLLGIYLLGGFGTSIIILVISVLFEIFLWCTAFAIAFGRSYYKYKEGRNAFQAIKQGTFDMIKFNFPRQAIWIGGIGIELLIASIIYKFGIPVENIVSLVMIGMQILGVLIGINLILGLTFSIIGLLIAKTSNK